MNDADDGWTPPPAPPPPLTAADVGFEALVDQFYQPLYRFALGLTRDPSQAGDLTQQTFYLWALRGRQLRDPQKVKGWLHTTLYREFLREVRRRRTHVVGVTEFDDGLDGVPSAEPGGAVAADGATALRALQRVTEPFRTPLLLFYLENFSYGEIARRLSIPLGTVMSRLSRGRSELRARFHGGGGEPPAPWAISKAIPAAGRLAMSAGGPNHRVPSFSLP